MSRKSIKKFIESIGATCKNWQWSWSFINEQNRSIIFGGWTNRHNEGPSNLIFSQEWEFKNGSKRIKGYAQSKEHIRLIEEEGFKLLTFPRKSVGGRCTLLSCGNSLAGVALVPKLQLCRSLRGFVAILAPDMADIPLDTPNIAQDNAPNIAKNIPDILNTPFAVSLFKRHQLQYFFHRYLF